MTEFKIALYGQADNDTKFVYTYPDRFNPSFVTEQDNWLKSVGDPRDARVFKTDRVYALWTNAYGNYYAVLVPNKSDTRNGYLILTLFVGRMEPLSGDVVVRMLDRLQHLIIIEGVRDSRQVAAVLAEFEPLFRPDPFAASRQDHLLQKAFRRYHNQAELELLLQYVHQADYVRYPRILMVPASAVPLQLSADYQELTATVVHSSSVVSADARSAGSEADTAQRRKRRLVQTVFAIGLFVAGFLAGRITAPNAQPVPPQPPVVESPATDTLLEQSPSPDDSLQLNECETKINNKI